MKKLLSILSLLLLSFGFFACESNSTAEEDNLYEINATGDDDMPTRG